MIEQRALGTSGIPVSIVGLGTWSMGGAWWGPSDDAESIRTIRRALDLGVTLFDTAEVYAAGHSEEVLGAGLEGRRHEAVISSKVGAHHFDTASVRMAFEDSCRRLRTDYIDVYFLHWPNIDVPIEETMTAMVRLKEEGKIRAIGVSNFTAAEMAEAAQFGAIDVLQPPYSLLWRFGEKEDFPWCQDHGVGLMTYSSLAQGLLTGMLRREMQLPDGDRRPGTAMFQPAHYGVCLDVVEQVRPIAAKHGKTVAQTALAWLAAQPGVSSTLVGARTVAEIEEDVGAAGWKLEPEDLAEIDRLGRSVTDDYPPYPDIFRNWLGWDLQRRRYEAQGRVPA